MHTGVTSTDLAALCHLLAQPAQWSAAVERLRTLLASPSLTFIEPPEGQVDPPEAQPTHWRCAVEWDGSSLGWFEADAAPADAEALAAVLPLVGWARRQQRDAGHAASLLAEVRRVAGGALDFAEFVTWLLHASDEREVERLGTHAMVSLLKAGDGALLRRARAGWVLSIPARELSVTIEGWETGVFGRLLTRESVEVEATLEQHDDELTRALASWGYSHAFAVPLDTGNKTQGVLFAVSKLAGDFLPEMRISATQLAILVSVTLDRFEQQRRLSDHQKSLEDALRIANMGTWEFSLRSDEITWSPELHRIYGGAFTPKTQSSFSAMVFMNLDTRLLQNGGLRELLETGEVGAWPSEVRTLNGRIIWTRTSCELVRDADGRAVRIRGVTRDVTVEVSSQLERERALSRATRYERLFAMSDTLAVVCGVDGLIEEVSPSWTRQLGYEPCELRGVGIATLLHPEDEHAIVQLFAEKVSGGSPVATVLRLRSRDGQWRWLSWTAVVDGDRVYAGATDITSLQETSQRLMRSEEQLRQAGAIARIGAWSLDDATGVVDWSDEVRRSFETPAGFVPSLSDLERFYEPRAAARLRAAIETAVSTEAPFDLELEVITWNGRRIIGRHQANVETCASGSVRLVGAFQDVTEQHMAREAALAASRVKSQFLANMSHEVRTPLNGILGMTRLALETTLSVEQREYLEAVRVSGDNLLAIVNDILDISKIESGKLELEHAPFSVKQAVFEAARNQASRAHARDIELIVDVDPNMAEQHHGDAVRVGQVASNLVGNAVKFTERGQVSIEVRQLVEGVEVAVRDTGIGIPSDRVHAIFEAFTQADGGTNRRFGGTGLGLTITLELVKRMGGRVDVESEPGKGSCFRVFLPLLPVEGVGRRGLSLRRGAALVVSDQLTARAVTARQLSQLGFDVAQTSGMQAMQYVLEHQGPLALLVIDHELEQTTGVELGEALQQAESLRDVPRILLARTTSRPGTEELAAAGVRRVLSRPASLSELTHAVLQLEQAGASSVTQERAVGGPPRRRQLKLLLAEDNAINARLAQRLCERLGHQVVHVANGALAVAAVERERWDAVLMDMQMPVLGGLEATRFIRDFESARGSKHLPIIALTASAMKGDEDVGLAAGMDAYLTKPVSPEKLADVLERLTFEAQREEKSA